MLRTLRSIVESETKYMATPDTTSQNYSVLMIPMSSNGNPDVIHSEYISLYYLLNLYKNSPKEKDESKSFEIHEVAKRFCVILDYSKPSKKVELNDKK